MFTLTITLDDATDTDTAPTAEIMGETRMSCPRCGETVTHYRDGLVSNVHVAIRPLRESAPHRVDKRAPFFACDGCEWATQVVAVWVVSYCIGLELPADFGWREDQERKAARRQGDAQ